MGNVVEKPYSTKIQLNLNKTVEITGCEFKDGDLHIFGNDVSEENFQRIERNRIDEDLENELIFLGLSH